MSFINSIARLCEDSVAVELKELTRVDAEGRHRRHYLVGPVELPVKASVYEASFRWYVGGAVPEQGLFDCVEGDALTYKRCIEIATSLAFSSVLLLPGLGAQVPAVRVHSCCTTGDLFGSERCDCGSQLRASIAAIVERGAGMLVYEASHEGRGIGLLGKLLAYSLQSAGADTYSANHRLGFHHDAREFAFAEAVVAAFYGDCEIELLTNNPAKIEHIAPVVRNVQRAPLHGAVTPSNERYLRAKHANGHLLLLDRGGVSLPPGQRRAQAPRSRLPPLSDREVAGEVERLVRELAPYDWRGDYACASLIADLGYDSLSLWQLVAVLEERFGLTASDDELFAVDTVGDIAALVWSKLEHRPR